MLHCVYVRSTMSVLGKTLANRGTLTPCDTPNSTLALQSGSGSISSVLILKVTDKSYTDVNLKQWISE